jgi:hypothetical protein
VGVGPLTCPAGHIGEPYTQNQLDAIADQLNTRPRKTLDQRRRQPGVGREGAPATRSRSRFQRSW